MGLITLVTIHNSFDRTGRDTRQIETGLSLTEIQRMFLPAAVDFVLSVNGRVVADMDIVPRPGDQITAVPVLTGSNGGKMVGRIIAMIVITVMTYGVGAMANAGYLGYSSAALAVAQGGMAAAMAGAAIMLVGGMLVNMAFTPRAGDLQTTGNSATASPAYGWAPQSTQQQGIILPRWYGKNKLYGNIIVGHITYSGNNSYINALINLGFGPFSNVSDFSINDQPASNFVGIEPPAVRLGNLTQTVIPYFTDTAVEYSTSILVTNASPVIFTTNGDSFDALEILLQCPNGLGYYSDTGAMISLEIKYVVSIKKHTESVWNIVSQTPGTTLASSSGHWSRGYYYTRYFFRSFTTTVTWIEKAVGSTIRTDHIEGEASGVFSGQVQETWRWLDSNIITQTATSLLDYVIITGAQATPLKLMHGIDILDKGIYDVKVERVTADFTDSRQLGSLYLAAVNEITRKSFTYPRQVLVGLKALATNQLSGSLRFSCLAKCAIIRVWDGTTWSNQYNTNPAWVCYDVLTQPVMPDAATSPVRYDGIDPARIDHVRFKEWADYCDELLPDGNGGTEKRIEFNGGFDSEMSLWEAVLRICSVAYAIPVWNGIKLSVSIDKPADPVQLFSLGNIDQDSFKETFLPMGDRAAEIEVDFINQENNYQRDKLTVANTAMTTVTSKVNLSMFGVTKPSMAWRGAMRKLAYNQHIGRTVDFGADIDAIACTVGDVILVQHDVPQWGYGGRVVSATTTTIIIDQSITLASATQYSILVRMGDDSLVERDITNTPGDTTVLTVSPAFSSAPQQFDVFTVGKILKTAKPFRVSNISRDSDLKAHISAVEYVAGIYNVDYDVPVTGALDYTQPLTPYKQSLPPFEVIIGLTVKESLRKITLSLVSSIATIYWTPVVNRYAFPSVGVWAWQDDTVPQLICNTPISADSFDWIVPVDEIYWNFVVAVVNLNGELQPLTDLVPYRIFIKGKTAPPGDVYNFKATPTIQGGLRLTWDAVTDLDLLEYSIRHSPLKSGAVWENSTEIIRTVALYSNLNLALTGTYMIKATDTTGHKSVNMDSLIINTMASNTSLFPYTTITENPAWSGAKTNLTLTSGELFLTASGADGVYQSPAAIDLPIVRTARVSAKCIWSVQPGVFDTIAALDDLLLLDEVTGLSKATVYIWTSQTTATPTFKQPLFLGDYTFKKAFFTVEVHEQVPDRVRLTSLIIKTDLHDIAVTYID